MGNKKSTTVHPQHSKIEDYRIEQPKPAETDKLSASVVENKNLILDLKDLYGLSSTTLSYIENTCNDNDTFITDIKWIRKHHLIQECLINNFKIDNFEVSIIRLIVEYCKYEPFETSNEICDRWHCDGARDMDLIDTTFKMPKDGIIKEWSFYAQRKATLYGTVWRNTNLKETNGEFNNNDKKPEYTLIALVKFPAISCAHSKNRYTLPENEVIEVLKDDYIGIRWDGHSSIPSAIGTGNIVHWSYPKTTPKIGEKRTFHVGDHRDYAYGFSAEL